MHYDNDLTDYPGVSQKMLISHRFFSINAYTILNESMEMWYLLALYYNISNKRLDS